MKSKVKWISGLVFESENENHNTFLMAGANQNINAQKPIEVLLSALAACTSVDVLSILENENIKVQEYSVDVEASRSKIAPKPIEKFKLIYNIKASNLNKEKAIEIINYALNQESGVAGTYNSKIDFDVNINC